MTFLVTPTGKIPTIGDVRATRQTKAFRLAALGWTQEEIGEVLEVGRSTITEDVENCEIAKIDKSIGKLWNDKTIGNWSNRMAIPLTDAMAGRSRESLTG